MGLAKCRHCGEEESLEADGITCKGCGFVTIETRKTPVIKLQCNDRLVNLLSDAAKELADAAEAYDKSEVGDDSVEELLGAALRYAKARKEVKANIEKVK